MIVYHIRLYRYIYIYSTYINTHKSQLQTPNAETCNLWGLDRHDLRLENIIEHLWDASHGGIRLEFKGDVLTCLFMCWAGPCSLNMPVESGRRMWRMVWETTCIMPRVRWGYKVFLPGIFLTCWVSFWTTSGRSHFAVGRGPVVSGYQIHRSMAPGLATWFRRPETQKEAFSRLQFL